VHLTIFEVLALETADREILWKSPRVEHYARANAAAVECHWRPLAGFDPSRIRETHFPEQILTTSSVKPDPLETNFDRKNVV